MCSSDLWLPNGCSREFMGEMYMAQPLLKPCLAVAIAFHRYLTYNSLWLQYKPYDIYKQVYIKTQ